VPLPFDVCRMRRPKRSDDHGEMQGPLHLALKILGNSRRVVASYASPFAATDGTVLPEAAGLGELQSARRSHRLPIGHSPQTAPRPLGTLRS